MSVDMLQADTAQAVRILPGAPAPAIIQPLQRRLDLVDWAAANIAEIEALLLRHGAVLLRGFKINGSAHFERLIEAMYQRELLEYRNRSTPRTVVKGKIYTSTEYPADEHIPLHNENAYTSSWPSKVFFFCVKPSETGGETPIADSRRIYARLPAELRDKFERLGVRYVRNYGLLDLPWQEVFQTEDRAEVEAFCTQRGIDYAWKDDGGLRTGETCQASAVHPVTGEKVWFNQAHLFHASALKPEVREALYAGLGEQDLPRNACYGDGTPLEAETLQTIRAAIDAETLVFPWQAGDILLVDNLLAAHGRRPYSGSRQVLVGMV
jgi:alpha-ketoglutarate-dependent taurine dioxygenase